MSSAMMTGFKNGAPVSLNLYSKILQSGQNWGGSLKYKVDLMQTVIHKYT
jgi:hypothetical protein